MAEWFKAAVLKFGSGHTPQSCPVPYPPVLSGKIGRDAFSYRSSSLLIPSSWVANPVAIAIGTTGIMGWRFPLFLVALAVVTVAWGWATSSQGLCSVAVATSAMKGDQATWCGEFWVNRYQTLIAAVVAIAASGVAFAAVRMQVNQAAETEERRVEREEYAARALLSLTLSSLCEYAEACMRIAARHDRPSSRPHFPGLPSHLEANLHAAVLAARDPHRRELGDLTVSLQIFLARTRPEPNVSVLIEDLLFDAADLYARASRLFPYARADLAPTLVRREDIQKALIFAGIEPSHWPHLKYLFEHRDRQVAEAESGSVL